MAVAKELTESRSRKDVPKVPGKVCLHCGVNKDLSEYYKNKNYEEQLGLDGWCKKCVGQIRTKDALREYFWENNREWNETLWQVAYKKAEEAASTKDIFKASNEDRKLIILEQLACQNVPPIMSRYYKYVDNKKDGILSYAEAKEKGLILDNAPDPNIKVYSEEFNGNFKPDELQYLNNYYKSLCDDVEITTQSHRDYAKKLAKASLQADKAQDDFAAGRCDYQLVKDSMQQFDMLSKSANFAPSVKKKDGNQNGLGSFSEIALYLEQNGHPCTRKIEWEQDDVDKTLNEFMHIVESLGLDQI